MRKKRNPIVPALAKATGLSEAHCYRLIRRKQEPENALIVKAWRAVLATNNPKKAAS